MKLKTTLLTLCALLGVNLTTSLAGNPPAKHKTEKAVAKQTTSSTTAQAKAEETIPGVAVQSASYFYTGKPYDEDLGGYVFNYRTYSPSIARWTTSDPSGYPDGTNNKIYVNNCVSAFFDANGLEGKSIVWLAAYTGASEADWLPDLINSKQSEYYQSLQTKDAQNPKPHYLDDGDQFDYGSIGKPSDLKQFKDYKMIILVCHGMVINGKPSWNVGCGTTQDPAKRYTTNDLKFYYKDLLIKGCGYGDIDGESVIKWMQDKTKEYLINSNE